MSRLLVRRGYALGLAGFNHLIEAGWLLLAACLPALFFPSNRNPFELPKALLLWLVIGDHGCGVARRKFQGGTSVIHRSPPVTYPASYTWPSSCLSRS